MCIWTGLDCVLFPWRVSAAVSECCRCESASEATPSSIYLLHSASSIHSSAILNFHHQKRMCLIAVDIHSSISDSCKLAASYRSIQPYQLDRQLPRCCHPITVCSHSCHSRSINWLPVSGSVNVTLFTTLPTKHTLCSSDPYGVE